VLFWVKTEEQIFRGLSLGDRLTSGDREYSSRIKVQRVALDEEVEVNYAGCYAFHPDHAIDVSDYNCLKSLHSR
jgi:Pyruvate/2-oxoacid:ferredoxin oxidoreductase delta subunit